MPGKHLLVNNAQRQCIPVVEACTEEVEAAQRIAYWEAHNAAKVVGLKCREVGGVALAARERNYDLGAVRLSEISGSAHEIERCRSLVRRLPKESLFASVLVEGQGYFLQAGRKVWLKPGEAVLYATNQPYLFSFSKPMRQILVDLNLHAEHTHEWPCLNDPVYVGQGHRLDHYDMAALLTILTDFVRMPERNQANCVATSIQTLIGRALGKSVYRGRNTTAHLRYARAAAFIVERALDPRFNREELAFFMGLSVRSVERLFERFGTTVCEVVWQQRLLKAQRLLTARGARTLTMAHIAAQAGFATQAHFSTAFRHVYGVSPRQFREQHGVAN